MAITHISEAEAAADFPGLLARVRAGEEIVIDPVPRGWLSFARRPNLLAACYQSRLPGRGHGKKWAMSR